MSRDALLVLSGCGFLDGAEITEAVLSIYFLEREGFEVHVHAPDRDQHDVVDHQAGEAADDPPRNALVEAARIARGGVRPLSEARADAADALVLPGGFGVAKTLSDFAAKGSGARVDPEFVRLIGEFLDARKPIAALCISPAVLAVALKELGRVGVRLTIGEDEGTSAEMEKLGARHVACPVTSCVVDEDHHIVTAPAYMDDGASRAAVGEGIEKAIRTLARWVA